MRCYDLVVIGGGSAGLTAASIAGRVGASVLLVDRTALGGDCLHHGCVPSKALIHCANTAHDARTAGRFGVSVPEVTVHFSQVMGHVASTISAIGRHDSAEALAEHGVDVALGGAEYLSPTRIRVGGPDGEEIEARRSIIAVGSRAAPPPIDGLSEVGFIDHVGLFELEELPERLVVIGGGPIGVEMGQAMARLGSTVTIVELGPRVLPRDDRELARRLGELLSSELDLHLSAQVLSVSRDGGSKAVTFGVEGRGPQVVRCDEILVAAGRAPSFEGLGLDAAGVEVTAGGIQVDATLRTTASNIWASGDCVGPFQLTHFAEAQARVAARNALFLGNQKFADTVVPWTTFTDPELAHVGLTEEEAAARGLSPEVYRFGYDRLDRAVCDGATEGLGKILCDRKGRILGASILGKRAGEALPEVVLAMREGLSLSRVSAAIHAYPTMGRIIRRLGDERFFAKGVGPMTTKLFGQFNQCGE